MNTFNTNKASKESEVVFVACPRCGGTGYLPQYSHIEGGICFKCRGNKGKRYYMHDLSVFKGC